MLTEEQQAEIEALTSIFADTEVEVNEKDKSLTILLVPDPSLPVEAPENCVGIKLRLSLPPDYPSRQPVYNIVWKKNLDAARLKSVEAVITDVLESHAGYELLFDLFSAVTEWLHDNNSPLQSILDSLNATKDKTPEASDAEETEAEKKPEDDGRLADKVLVSEDCRVTEPEFMAWREEFRKEMIRNGIWRDLDTADSRLTGKQFFLNISSKSPEEQEGMASGNVFWENRELFEVDIDELE